MYQLKLEQFSGPIEKLLEIIESKKMEITEINLAEITADFLKYVETLSNTTEQTSSEFPTSQEANGFQFHPRILADFIVVASRLLLIKSKALLPNFELTEEEVHEIKDLETRLALYKQFKPAIKYLEVLMREGRPAYSRDFLANIPPIFYPTQTLTPEAMQAAMHTLYKSLEQVRETHTVQNSLINLEEKIQEVVARMNETASTKTFNELLSNRSKPEVIVLFLAMLHLLHRQIIHVEQQEGFSDIIIGKQETKN